MISMTVTVVIHDYDDRTRITLGHTRVFNELTCITILCYTAVIVVVVVVTLYSSADDAAAALIGRV